MTFKNFVKAFAAVGFLLFTSVISFSQTVTVTVTWTGAQANGCCDICGADYWCIYNSGGCGTPATSDFKAFFDPVPAGNVITGISYTNYGTSCNASSVYCTINNINLGGSPVNSDCTCGACNAYTSFSTFSNPCGISTIDYNYGGWNNFYIYPDLDYCVQRSEITFTYAPGGTGAPPQPGAITGPLSVCSGTNPGYSISAGTDTYNWTVPVGWTINSGQGTTAIGTTSGASGGNICVTATNSCGTSPATCVTVSTTTAPGTPGTPTGSTSVCGAVSTTYSTVIQAGATSYTWTVPAGWSITGGQGTITVSVTTSSTSGNICVTANNSCGSSAPSCLFVNTNAIPGNPCIPSGNASSCSNTGLTYSTCAVSGATGYTWTVPGSWVITGGQGTTSINVTTGTVSGNVCVTADNSCGSSTPQCFAVTITTEPATPGAIIGNATFCPGGVEPYSTGVVPGATSYTWTVPGGWTINSGQGTNSISVTTSASAGQVCVTASNSCGTSLQSCMTVAIGAAPLTPGSVSGPNPVCPNSSGNSYSIAPVASATTYTWSIPGGWVINSGQGTTSISATSGIAGGNICVTAGNACGTSSPSCIAVTIDATPSAPGMITGPAELCVNSSQNYSCTVVPGATSYTWTITGGVINSGQTTNTINATFTGAPGSLCVTANNSCGSSSPTCLSITVSPVSVGGTLTSSDDTVCTGSNSGTVTLSGQTGNVVKWQLSTDGGVSWSDIANITTTQIFNNLLDTTLYRAIIQSGTCAAETSTVVIIYVEGAGSAGEVVSSALVCSTSNGDTLELINYAGVIDHWEYSTDNGVTWDTIFNTDDTLVYQNLQTSTLYRAIMTGGGGGGCPNNVSSIASITVFPPSAGGIVLSDTTVCSGSNLGTLTLSGQVGAISSWEASVDGGTLWFVLSNTGNTLTFANLTQTTMFRVKVQSGVCPADYSVPATVTVDPVSNGGLIASNDEVCSGSNSGTLTIIGETGNVLIWGSSTDGGVTWTPIFNTTTSQNYSNLTTTTIYTAIVESGVCPADTSAFATILVDSATVGGSILSSDTVCNGSNSGILTLTGYTGTINGWELSTDGGSTWIPISNNTSSQAYNNLVTTTLYRVEVQSGECNSAYSAIATLTVDAVSLAGTITGGDITVCADTNSGVLTLNGYSGNILSWQSSIDGGITWVNIINTDDTLNYVNLTVSTFYRVIVKSGVCSADTSVPVLITVNNISIGGAIFIDDTVCSGSNNGILSLVGQTGTIDNWEISTDGGNTWSVLANNTDTLNYNNVSVTTIYRVKVQNGVCPADYSTYATITTDLPSIGGNVLSSTTVCSTINGDTLVLSGYIGSVNLWEYSTDGGNTWINIANQNDYQSYIGLTTTTLYRAIVQNGVCSPDTSDAALISVDPLPFGGQVIPQYRVCTGMNKDTLALVGYSGTIVQWEYFDTLFNQWTAIPTNNDTMVFSNLTATTAFRAVVGSGVCPTVTSTIDTVFVDQLSDAGILSLLEDTCCSVQNGFLANLTGYFKNIVKWEYSINNGTTWNSFYDTSGCGTGGCNWNDTLTYPTVPQNVLVRSIVKNGVCPRDTSNVITINKIVAINDYDTLNIDENLQIEVTKNDTGTWAAIDFCALPKYGTATFTVIGNQGILSYSPVPENSGRDTMVYYICDDLNCTSCDTAKVYLVVILTEDIFIPNGFSPDGDGINDKWVIQGLNEYPDNEIQIFNRWGDLVYRANPYKSDWDGKAKNVPMVLAGDEVVEGTYFYILNIFGSAPKSFNGFIEIRRKE
ncbi:MAG: gliding motility-associated C-terminal domain-containing protein [Bacteroidetes bacterium]|nr:gliding motility-associated C-terminal domain-containing protein [Bacteroidota bacterium]